jgi:hypothetical protein
MVELITVRKSPIQINSLWHAACFCIGRKSIPYEEDNSLNTGYAVTDLPFDLFDSIVYYPVTCSGLVF